MTFVSQYLVQVRVAMYVFPLSFAFVVLEVDCVDKWFYCLHRNRVHMAGFHPSSAVISVHLFPGIYRSDLLISFPSHKAALSRPLYEKLKPQPCR